MLSIIVFLFFGVSSFAETLELNCPPGSSIKNLFPPGAQPTSGKPLVSICIDNESREEVPNYYSKQFTAQRTRIREDRRYEIDRRPLSGYAIDKVDRYNRLLRRQYSGGSIHKIFYDKRGGISKIDIDGLTCYFPPSNGFASLRYDKGLTREKCEFVSASAKSLNERRAEERRLQREKDPQSCDNWQMSSDGTTITLPDGKVYVLTPRQDNSERGFFTKWLERIKSVGKNTDQRPSTQDQ